MSRFISKKDWGAFAISKAGEIKGYHKKPKDASQAIKWRNSKKKTVVSRAKAAKVNAK